MPLATRWLTKRLSVAIQIFEVQGELSKVIAIAGKLVEFLSTRTKVQNLLANFRRKIFDMLRVVAILASYVSTFRERLRAHRKNEQTERRGKSGPPAVFDEGYCQQH